jgi:hypothetical protein
LLWLLLVKRACSKSLPVNNQRVSYFLPGNNSSRGVSVIIQGKKWI